MTIQEKKPLVKGSPDELQLQEKIDLLAGLMLDRFFENVEKDIVKKGTPRNE